METPSAEQLQGFWKSRIVKYEEVDPKVLIPNPDNFKEHPSNQADLIDDVISEVGWIQNVVANIRTNHLIDGHLRVLQAIKHGVKTVPVTWVDIDPDEEAKAIALFDPSSNLAKQNREAVIAAIRKIKTGSTNIQAILDRIANRSKLPLQRMKNDLLEDEEDADDEYSETAEDVAVGEGYKLILGDCTEVMANLQDKSIDCVICDLPYDVTQAVWDAMVPLDEMWEHLGRIVKDQTMIVLFSAQPFTTLLIGSNHKQFKYEIIWVKNIPTGFLNAKIRPMAIHENICVFANGAMWYNPQMKKGKEHKIGGDSSSQIYGKYDKVDQKTTDEYYPNDVIFFDKGRDGTTHPSEKPLDLMRYLVNTYSKKGDTILDFTMGSGSTGVAAIQCGRKFIGIEKKKEFFKMALERIEQARNEVDDE